MRKLLSPKGKIRILLLLSLLLLLPSCGKQDTAEDVFRLRYVAQRTPLDISDTIGYACAAGDQLYYTTTQTSQKTNPDGTKTWKAVPYLFAVASDGTITQLKAYSDYEALRTEQGAGARYPQQLCAAPDGTLRLLINQRDLIAGSTESFKWTTWLLGLDQEGNLLFETQVERTDQQPASRWLQLCCDGDGRSYVQDREVIALFDGQGEALGAITGSSALLSVAKQSGETLFLAAMADGRAASVSWSRTDGNWTLQVMDPESLEFTAQLILPRTEGIVTNVRFFPGAEEYDLMCATDLSLYGYKLGKDGQTGTGEQLLSWINCDMEGADLLALDNAAQGSFACLSSSAYFGAEQVILSPGEPDDGETTILTLACRSLPSEISQMVVRYNRQNNGNRIQIQDYGAVAVQSGMASGLDQLTADLITGSGADLYCTNNMDVQTLIDQGFLEDLWPYIDNDEQLGGRDALVLPVFNALSQNGKLYEITNTFIVETAMGLTDVVGDTPGWTVEEFRQTADSLPGLCALTDPGYQGRESVLEDMIARCANSFIDRENWTASFDSAEFTALLEYAGMFPAEDDWDVDPSHWMIDREQLICPVTLLWPSVIKSRPIECLNGQPATFIGFPGVAGNGSVFRIENAMAMGANSQHKEQVWDFLRTMLMPATQIAPLAWEENGVGIPTNKLRYDAMIQAYQKEQEYETYIYNVDGEEVLLEPLTDEEAQEFRNLVNGITVVERTEEAIAAIIRDEAARFFTGDQTAEAAAKAIQSRVNLYLGERK